jgi:hypothetical protein
MKEINEDDLMERALSDQIEDFDRTQSEQQAPIEEPEITERPVITEPQKPKNEAAQYIGQKLSHKIGGYGQVDKEETKRFVEEHKLSRIGDNIRESADIRDGWMEVDRRLLGERDKFYPKDWKFRIRPASVEAIRNWSTIDDENINSIDDVFNEVMKACLSIVTPMGPKPWDNIRSWDRFFFLLLIREYTFVQGEHAIQYDEDCLNCDNPVTFKLTSTALEYDLPDPEVMKYFDEDKQVWSIDPLEYDVDGDPITLYLPTLAKDAAIKSWVIQRVQEKKKVDSVFIKFLYWMAPSINKDDKLATRQIREYELKFKSWDTDMFSLMDEIVRNITVTPSQRLVQTCPVCGEEVASEIRFPDGIRSLFSISNRNKKFGKK